MWLCDGRVGEVGENGVEGENEDENGNWKPVMGKRGWVLVFRGSENGL